MTAASARTELLDALVAAGDLDPSWRDTFDQVPRHEFIPDTIWRIDRAAGNRLVALHRGDDPDGWLARAYADRPDDDDVRMRAGLPIERPAAAATGRCAPGFVLRADPSRRRTSWLRRWRGRRTAA